LTDDQLENLVGFAPAHQPRAYVNSFVRFHHPFTVGQRLQAAKTAGWNVFQFPSEMLRGGDLLSDSGTTTLTLEQVSAMLLGDEAYGSNWGYFQLLDQFERTFGLAKDEFEVYLFHQGRAAEHALFSQLGHLQPGGIIPSNGHFDTTRANIEASGMTASDLFSSELHPHGFHPFKGNMDLAALHKLLQVRAGQIPVVYCTITNNTGGGQPVALDNLRAIRQLCDQFHLPFFLDACRFAENAWFIQHRETGYAQIPITEIVHQTFALCDGFTISLKKDGLANMGGALVIRKNSVLVQKHPALLNALRDHQILVEGHPTYGGLSGRDIMVITDGLKTVVTEQYLHSRIDQVRRFGERLAALGIPVVEPFGGHAIYIDVDEFFADTALKRHDFGGIALTGLLLLKGIRLCELGAFAFGKFDPATGQEAYPPQNFVRCAIPRNKYEEQDLFFVADCVAELHRQRHQLPRAVPVFGRQLSLRHFKARFELVPA
jgi:tryptophanase